jgi:hypothetical protein
MKKFMLLCAAMGWALACHSQVIFGPEAGFGVGRTSYADPSHPAKPTVTVTQTFGLSLWTTSSETVNIMAGLRYGQSKNVLEGRYEGTDIRRELKSTYVYLPARITFAVLHFNRVSSLHAYAGPECSYWLRGRATIRKDENGEQLAANRVDFTALGAGSNRLNRVQFGYQAGITFLSRHAKSSWAVSLQYSHTLSKQVFGNIVYAGLPGFVDDYAFRNEMFTLQGTFYLDSRTKKKMRNTSKFVRHHGRKDL